MADTQPVVLMQVVDALKHLPGKHDQKSHGVRGSRNDSTLLVGGSGYQTHRDYILDWLDRHDLNPDANGMYTLYHGTTTTVLDTIKKEGLRVGSLLEVNPREAAQFAKTGKTPRGTPGYGARDLPLSKVVLLEVRVTPDDIEGGFWASTQKVLTFPDNLKVVPVPHKKTRYEF